MTRRVAGHRPNDWRGLTGKAVVVVAGGIRYRGVLLEMGDASLVLRSARGFQEIPWERVTSLAEDPVRPARGPAGAPLPDGWR